MLDNYVTCLDCLDREDARPGDTPPGHPSFSGSGTGAEDESCVPGPLQIQLLPKHKIRSRIFRRGLGPTGRRSKALKKLGPPPQPPPRISKDKI